MPKGPTRGLYVVLLFGLLTVGLAMREPHLDVLSLVSHGRVLLTIDDLV